ncbi:MAG: hypothetical protein QXZ20_02890 [Candidatus Aenigmatarchaeota archaeon]
MKELMLLTIFLIILFSLCTIPEIPFLSSNASVQKAGLLIIDQESPDMFVSMEAIPSEVKAERNVNIYFELRNKNNYDLKNVSLLIYDPCIFTGETSKSIGDIKANRTYSFSLKLTAGKTDLDKNCNIKFKIEYNAENSLFQDIAVLTKSEYEQRELAGTLSNIPIQSFYPDSPLRITLSFSDDQPFMENENYYLYLDYYNKGGGFIEVKKGDIKITAPSNVKDFSCKDYKKLTKAEFCSDSFGKVIGEPGWDPSCDANNDNVTDIKDIVILAQQLSNILKIDRNLNFINNRASTSTCSFTAIATQPTDIKSFAITTSYKYILDGSILIKVKRI